MTLAEEVEHGPRSITAGELFAVKKACPDFKGAWVIGDSSKDYNCLGWAVQEKSFFNGNSHQYIYKSLENATHFLSSKGFEPTTADSPDAVIDVWGLPAPDASGNVVQHFSLRYKDVWTSKIGESVLLVHDRDLVGGAAYGHKLATFKRKAGHALAAMIPVQAETAAAGPLAASEEELSAEDVSTVLEHASLAASLPALAARAPARPAAKPAPKPVHPTAPAKPTHTTPPAKPAHSTTPAKPAPPTVPAKPTHPTVPAKPTNPTKTTPPKSGPTSSPATAAFAKTFAAWKKTWDLPEVQISSNLSAYRASTEYKALIKLGAAITPQLVAELSKAENIFVVIPILDLNPNLKITSLDLNGQKKEIISQTAKTARSTQHTLAAFSIKKDSVISAGLTGAKLASELLTDPLFQAVVKIGIAAVPNILQARAKDGSTGKAVWEAMLKQIHAIEQHGGPSKDQVQEFEQWLAGYLGVDITPPATGNAPPATDGTAPAADDTPQDSSDAPSTEDTTTPTTEDSPSLPGLTASLAAIGLPSAPTED